MSVAIDEGIKEQRLVFNLLEWIETQIEEMIISKIDTKYANLKKGSNRPQLYRLTDHPKRYKDGVYVSDDGKTHRVYACLKKLKVPFLNDVKLNEKIEGKWLEMDKFKTNCLKEGFKFPCINTRFWKHGYEEFIDLDEKEKFDKECESLSKNDLKAKKIEHQKKQDDKIYHWKNMDTFFCRGTKIESLKLLISGAFITQNAISIKGWIKRVEYRKLQRQEHDMSQLPQSESDSEDEEEEIVASSSFSKLDINEIEESMQ